MEITLKVHSPENVFRLNALQHILYGFATSQNMNGFKQKDNKLHFKKDDQYKMFHSKVKGFLKKRQDRYIVMVSCYITNRQMINYSCVPLKGFEKKLTKLFVKTLLKHH